MQDLEGPGPGEYKLPGAFHEVKEKPRRDVGSAWAASTTKRFVKEPELDDITPSAVHYTPNYSSFS